MDDLHFDYPQSLQDRLALREPDTDRSIRRYQGNANFWDQQFETDAYELLAERIKILPDIPDERLTTDFVLNEWIPRLAEGFDWQKTVAERTALYNQSKPAGQIRDQLGLIIARIVPLFLLETTSTMPRVPMFELKNEKNKDGEEIQKIYRMLKLPQDEIYANQA